MEKYRVLADDLKLGDVVEDTAFPHQKSCRFQVVGFSVSSVLMQLLSGDGSIYLTSATDEKVYPFSLKDKYYWYKIN